VSLLGSVGCVAGRGVITDNGVVLVGGGEELTICIEPILAIWLISRAAADSCYTYCIAI